MDGARERRAHLSDAELAAAEAVSIEELGGAALDALKRAIGASNILLYRYDEHRVVHGVAGSLSGAIETYAAELFMEDPVQRHLMKADPASPIVVLRDMTPTEYLRSGAYNEFYKPHDVHHLMRLWLTDVPYGAPGMTGILFTRAAKQADFDVGDFGALERALPSFRAAVRRASRIERDRRELDGALSVVAPGARLALDRDGRLLWMSHAAETMLGSGARRAASGAGSRASILPPALREAATRLAAITTRELTKTPPPFEIDLVVGSHRVVAELQIGRSPAGETIVAVTLRERGGVTTSAHLEALAARHGLTKAERTVLACLGEGLSNRDIAARLFVSLETVKTHVQRILGKLEVASRTQAALRLRTV